jgi:autotransporter-associated beta strand protein
MGIGALTNTNTALRQLNAFQKVTLTADATVGGPGRIEVRAPINSPAGTAVLDLAGHTLTKIGDSTFGIARADATPGNIHVIAGTLNIEGSTNITGAGTLTFDTETVGQFNGLTGTVSRNIVLNGGQIGDTSNSTTTTVPSNISLIATSSNINVNSPGGLTLPGVISGAAGAGFNKTGTGMLTIGGNNTYSGVTSINNGTLVVASSANLGNASATNNLAFGGASGGTLRATGAVVSPGRSIAVNGAGAIDTNGFDSSFGPIDGSGSFTKTGAGVLTIGGHVICGDLTVSAGRLAMTPDSGAAGVSRVGALSITGATLDLAANKLITNKPAGTFSGGAYSGVQGDVANAYNFGSWDQPGLMTSMPDAGPSVGITTIGVATAEQILFIGASETGVFAGQTVTGATTLAVYTYAGDLNFDGLVDAADYGVIDNFVQFPGTDGYANGDFNYDGIIDAGDYGIIDNTIQLQGPPISVTAPVDLAGVTAVPEPSAVLVSLLPIVAAARRRRRR